MKGSTITIVGLLGIIVALVVVNRQQRKTVAAVPERIDMVSEVKGPQLAYLKRHTPANTVSNAVQASEWANAQVDAVPILLHYMPNATEEQQQAATQYVFHYRSFRPDWIKEARAIRKRIDDLNHPSVPPTSRIEIGRIHQTEWDGMVSMVNEIMRTLRESDVKYFANHGFVDPNLQSDLYNAANPPGKEPWEE